MSVQLNTSAKEMPAAAQSQPAANAQPQKGKSAQANLCTEIVPFEAPLLEGSIFPMGVQEVITSFFSFSKEMEYVFDEAQGKIQGREVVAEPGEATIDALCRNRTEELFQTRMKNICALREVNCAYLTLVRPGILENQKLLPPRPDENGLYNLVCGMDLSPEMALQRCTNPMAIHMMGLNYSGEELQRVLQSKKAKAVQLDGLELSTRNIKLTLPDLQTLGIGGVAFEALDVTQCPKLRELYVFMHQVNSRAIRIDTSGLNGCKVTATTQHPITLLATDAQGKEVVMQGQHNLQDDRVTLDYEPQDKVEKKKE